ncbi:SLC13 family permease [Microvirga yunnanensis]|uniref:SLC13 family permease n=1 Tax=Microvirga yunnanensis TaxID=2953740 RepID=UPI0021C5FAE0|nr:SLC13 family permease [Microvirga sp. HBU65207]
MSPQLISIYALAAMFVVATILPINMGVLAFVGAFLVGTLVAGQTTSAIIAGFPGGLFLTLVGITFLFAIAQNNGTIDWLVRLAVRGVRGRIVAIPWIMFGISAVLTSVGAVSPGAVAIIAPIALGFALKYSINPLLMGLMVVHGAQAGGFSPISIYGGITNRVVAKAGLPLNEIVTFLASFGVNLAVAVLLFFALGGRRLLQARADVLAGQATANAATAAQPPAPRAPAVARAAGNLALAIPPIAVTVPQAGPQVYGDAESEALTEERMLSDRRDDPLASDNVSAKPAEGPHWYRVLTLGGLILLAVLTLAFNLDIGFVAITIGLGLSLIAPNLQKRAMGQVSWPEIMLITGVSTYVVVLEKMGTISFVGDSVAGLASPMLAALLLCFIGAVVSAFASSTAVLGSLIPLAVPFLQSGTGVSPIGFIAAMAVASTIVDVSPFSTNGALVLANAQGVDREAFFRKLMAYGALVTVVAPIVVWALFVVL